MRQLVIGNRVLSDDDVWVCAEIGSNHGGDVDLCEKMIVEAARCGVDAVKLQKRDNTLMFTKAALNKPYDNEFSYGKTYGEHRQHLDWFGRDEFFRFKKVAEAHGVLFFATPFEEASADFLDEIGMPLWKIASCDVRNLPLCRKVAKFGQPVLISVGGASMDDIQSMVDTIHPINDDFALLHCVSVYPNTDFNLNLKAITTLREFLPNHIVGFSSHHPGLLPLMVARTLGASIFEVHFTLNRGSRGTDHGFSIEPHGLEMLCNDLKRVKTLLGNGDKVINPSESKGFVYKFGKAVHAARYIPAGKVIEVDDLAIKAPADGLPPGEFDNLIGRVSINDLSTESIFSWEDFA
jgi:sialic acid synthase